MGKIYDYEQRLNALLGGDSTPQAVTGLVKRAKTHLVEAQAAYRRWYNDLSPSSEQKFAKGFPQLHALLRTNEE